MICNFFLGYLLIRECKDHASRIFQYEALTCIESTRSDISELTAAHNRILRLMVKNGCEQVKPVNHGENHSSSNIVDIITKKTVLDNRNRIPRKLSPVEKKNTLSYVSIRINNDMINTLEFYPNSEKSLGRKILSMMQKTIIMF